MIYGVMMVVVLAITLTLKLNVYGAMATILIGLIMLPRHRKLYKRTEIERRRFFEASEYMDALMYNFLREEKIEKTYENLISILEPSHMLEVVELALEHMKLTFDETAVYRDAMGMIEKEYSCSRITNMHDFMYNVENYGGDIARPIEILVEDKNAWGKRIEATMQERKRMFMQVVMSVVASLIICGMILYLPIRNIDISSNVLVQIVGIGVLVLDDLIILRAQRYLACDWLTLESESKKKDVASMVERWRNNNDSKERKKSFVLGVVTMPLMVLFYYLWGKWGVLIGMVLFVVALNQHKIGNALLNKSITKEIKKSFPRWLLDIVLLLQSENVQVAIQKSIQSAPRVLQSELMQLNERLEIEPEGSSAYHLFFSEFHVPEIHSAMNMLYSLSMGNSFRAEEQLGELIHRNLLMLDESEREEMKNKTARMYLLFLAPVLTASIKLLVDMLVVMFAFLSSVSL